MLDDINDLRKDILEYIEVRFDQIRLHTAESLSRIFSDVAKMAVIGYLFSLMLLFLSFAAGFYLGSLLNSNELGFICVAGFYLLLIILFLLLRKRIVEKPVIKAMVRLFFPKFEDNEKK